MFLLFCTVKAQPRYLKGNAKLPDGFDHAKAHFDTTMSMVLAGFRESRNTIVAVPKYLNTKTVMFLEGKK